MTEPLAERLLVVAPTGRDAELICSQLSSGGLKCEVCPDVDGVCSEIPKGVGGLIFTEEALLREPMRKLAAALVHQPPWSEIPIIILTGLPSIEIKTRSFEALGRRTNVTLIDRPVRIKSLISAAQAVLRARERQYEIRDLMLALEERVQERDRFLAILGHELRNPLGAILLASQMVEGEDGSLAGEHARLIERQSRHLTRLVNDLLDLSRVVSGKIVLKPQIVNLTDIARQSLETTGDAAKTQKIDIALQAPREPLQIHADPVRIDQIITNVLTNAVKYTPEGGHVMVTLGRSDGRAVVTVKDDGVGVDPERIGTIFELFAQAENAIGRAQGGMGIGLALVRNLVDLHGGTISAKSDGLGKGSEFRIEFPLATAVSEDQQPVAGDTVSTCSPAPRSIVIVEDNPDVRDLLRLKLRKLGHSVEAVGDGVSGVDTILKSRPDMALVDIGLPGMDGYEVAARVRKELDRSVVLIAVSGFGQPEDKRKALQAGFDDHLTKPADVSDIEGLLSRFPPPVARVRRL